MKNSNLVYVYLNEDRKTVYANFQDSYINMGNKSLTRYLVSEKYSKLFARLFTTGLHSNAKQNIAN
jgi:hypothetical protein